ncbi:MAG: tetratricopeptide repeat protein [Ignavibacteria bacterium]|nr:tetratricopeptide repeat protein [Ignavibacteria bacterium]
MFKSYYFILFAALITGFTVFASSCNFITSRSISKSGVTDSIDPEPDYNISLNPTYQDLTNYIFMGNRMENFSTYFNVYYTAQSDFDEAMKEIRTSTISAYSRRLDSLNIDLPISQNVRDKLKTVLSRASKVIQYHKNSKFLDRAVLLIGKTYYYQNDYFQAERSLSEFLSKLSSSTLSDEAILFLGKTKFKLGRVAEAETIFQKLIKESKNPEIISEAYQDLALDELSKRNYSEAVKYFENSIKFTVDNDKKAEREYILATIFSLVDPSKSMLAYERVVKLSSDFDLSFYSNLNFAKSLIQNRKFAQAENVLNDLNSKYRDYPEYKQLAELELANNLNAQDKSNAALLKYYEVILKYPNSKASSDAYYYIAEYYEKEKNDYLNALVNYNKVVQESSFSDYITTAIRKSALLDKYFTLQAQINGTDKINIPLENQLLERYRLIFDEERGIDPKREGEIRDGEDPNRRGEDPTGDPKGGGFNSSLIDSMDTKDNRREKLNEDGSIDGENTVNEKNGKENPNDTLDKNNENKLDEAGLENEIRYNSLYEMAELFMYELNKPDSAENYLLIIKNEYNDADKTPKVLYTLATLYKSQKKDAQANAILNDIILLYPNSIFANESRKMLGIKEVELEKDEAEESFNTAVKTFNSKDYFNAVAQFNNVLSKYPNSSYIDNTLYSLGWIYENVYFNKDSTLYYYNKIIKDYSSSNFVPVVKPIVENYEQLPVTNDSLNFQKTDSVNVTSDSLKNQTDTEIKTEEKTGEETNKSEEKLSQEEIEELLKKEDEIVPDPK